MCILRRRSEIARNSRTGRRSSPVRNSMSTSGGTAFTNTTTSTISNSKESQASRESRVSRSSSTSSSSLAGIRELLPDGPIIYRFRELVAATADFGDAHKVGRSTFRAPLRGAQVAIVRKRGSFVPNYIELIKVLSSIHHVNLVKLLGACFREGEYVHLCYEYEAGANLRDALSGGSKAAGFSTLSRWTTRLQLALDVALGLEYLHDHTLVPSFLHKNIKSTNIIVTNELRAKIAKFGIPQLLGEVPLSLIKQQEQQEQQEKPPGKLARSNSFKITGTPGYMAPEYVNHGTISTKMDVFSYGVVLLELLSGQQSGPQYDSKAKKIKLVSLPETIREIFEDDGEAPKKLRLWIDPKLKDSFPRDVTLSVARLAKLCVEVDPAARPPMKNVTARLSRHLEASHEWEKGFAAFWQQQTETLEGR